VQGGAKQFDISFYFISQPGCEAANASAFTGAKEELPGAKALLHILRFISYPITTSTL